jgi:O-antigen/teichoic acid export membrane protein
MPSLFAMVVLVKLCVVVISLVILLPHVSNAVAPALAYLLSIVIPLPIYLMIFFQSVFPTFLRAKASWNKKLIKELFSFGFPVIVSGASLTLFDYTDTLIITLFRTLEEVAMYQVAMPTSKVLWRFAAAVMPVLFPLSAGIWAHRNKKSIAMLIREVYKYSAIIILPASFALFWFARPILESFFGNEYIQATFVLQVLALTAIVFTLGQLNNALMLGIDQQKKIAQIMLFAAFFNVIGNLILVPIFGILGAAISTLISFSLIAGISTLYLKKYIQYDVEWSTYMKISISFLELLLISLVSLLFLLLLVSKTSGHRKPKLCGGQ